MTWLAYKQGRRHVSVATRRLRRTAGGPQATLDLHGYTLAAAQTALQLFLQQASAQGASPVLIIHGRGGRHPGRPSLYDMVPQWLCHHPLVLADQPAGPTQGGVGARLVWVRKV